VAQPSRSGKFVIYENKNSSIKLHTVVGQIADKSTTDILQNRHPVALGSSIHAYR